MVEEAVRKCASDDIASVALSIGKAGFVDPAVNEVDAKALDENPSAL